jgi:tetratricopeptide (TPR) repeat protein
MKAFAAIAALLLLAQPAVAGEGIIPDFGMAWKLESTWRRGRSNSIATFIRKAEQACERGRFRKAIKWYGKIEEQSINLRNVAKAVICQGYCYEQLGERMKAVEKYRLAVDKHANAVKSFVEILKREYEIANYYYDGGTDRFLFMSFNNYDLAIEIYEHIATSAPFADMSADAVYRAAMLSHKMKYYEDAVDLYKKVINTYPRHPRARDARLDLAHTLIAYSREADGDGALIRRARKELVFLSRYGGDFERREEAKELLAETERIEAARLLYLGEFYQREAHPRITASRRYLQDVVDNYEDADMVRLADTLLYTLEDADVPETDEQPAPAAPPKIKLPPRQAAPEKVTPAPAARRPAPKADPPAARKPLPQKTGVSSGKFLRPIEDLNAPEADE